MYVRATEPQEGVDRLGLPVGTNIAGRAWWALPKRQRVAGRGGPSGLACRKALLPGSPLKATPRAGTVQLLAGVSPYSHRHELHAQLAVPDNGTRHDTKGLRRSPGGWMLLGR